jgi:Tubulin-tyrosine ligase family
MVLVKIMVLVRVSCVLLQEYLLSFMQDVHLTNVAVQKTAPDYDPEKGSKWSCRQLRLYLMARYGKKAVSTHSVSGEMPVFNLLVHSF